MIQIAQWDTDHFGMKVGNLVLTGTPTISLLREEIAEAHNQGYELLYLKDTKLPEDCLSDDVLLADEKVLYSQVVADNNFQSDEHVVSYLHQELDVKLLSLALQSGGHSRYFTDKRMPVHVYLTLYQIWIANSLNGTIATDVLVYKEGDNILGLLSYKLIENGAVIGLVDVDKAATGKGIGSKLMQSFLARIPAGTKVEVATQKSNSRACHYYEKNGFEVESITNVYHIWMK